MTNDGVKRDRRGRPARDLAAEAQDHLAVRQTFVKHAMTRLPLVGVFVITINLFVQVRGDIGLAVAVAQNLTFGAIAVIVLLNLVIYIMLVVMVAAMPLVFDDEYNRWTRIVGAGTLVILTIVLCYTASWLLLVGLVLVFAVVGIVVVRSRQRPLVPLTRDTVEGVLASDVAPVDSGQRMLWAEGRVMLRATTPDAVPVTAAESAMEAPAEPKAFAALADEWNGRAVAIQEPRAKSVTRLAFAGIIGFIALFSVNIVTQPIRFAPLELVTIQGEEPASGFLLLQGGRGVFVPNPTGTVQFIEASQIASVSLCEDQSQWWSMSIVDLFAPAENSGVDCSV